LKAEVLNHPVHTANADGPAALGQFLGDHFGGSLEIEEAVSDDLADDFGRAPVVGLGTAFVGEQGQGTALPVSRAELEVALFAETEFLGRAGGAEPFTFALDKHGEFVGDFIVGGDRERTGGADELLAVHVELSHGYSWGRVRGRVQGEKERCATPARVLSEAERSN
jgi:hypothetical protein